MTVLYRGRNAPAFLPDDAGQVVNGGAARSVTPGRVASNQTWLAYRDPPAVNFFSGQQLLVNWGTTTLCERLRVEVPPGCTHVDFWFLVAGQMPDVETAPDLIHGLHIESVSTGNAAELTSIPLSSDNKFTPSISSARWIAAKGIPRGSPFGGPYPPGPFAVRCRDLPVSKWSEDWVKITTIANSLGMVVFSAYYKAVVPEGEIAYEDGST